MALQEGFNLRPSPRLVAEGGGRVARWVGAWIDLASASESAGMQRGRQVKHTAVSRRPGFPDPVEAVGGPAHFIA